MIISELCEAVNDSVCDGLVVVQSRKDAASGAEDLQSFCFLFVGLGGVFGALTGGLLMDTGRANYCFAIKSLLALAMTISAYQVDKSVE